MENDGRAIENPYAPPLSDSSQGVKPMKATSGSFWVEEGKLSILHEDFLPDVCLKTGAVEGWLLRNPERFSWRPSWIPWSFFLCVTGGLILWPPLVPVLLLSWLLVSIFTVKTISADFCLSKDAIRVGRILNLVKLSYPGLPIVMWFLPRDWFIIDLFLWPLGALVGLFLLNLLYPFPAPAGIRQGFVRLKNVSPEALR